MEKGRFIAEDEIGYSEMTSGAEGVERVFEELFAGREMIYTIQCNDTVHSFLLH